MEFKVNDLLIWQRANDTACQTFPQLIGKHYPKWIKELKSDLQDYADQEFAQNHTARNCLGLRGLANIGYTVPFELDIRDTANYVRTVQLHPEQLHGTRWAELHPCGGYIWGLHIVAFPWRAKMPRDWRLLINDYPLDWSADYHCFSGAVDANYEIRNNRNVGSLWNFDEEIDRDYNYYNLEIVLAIRNQQPVPEIIVDTTQLPHPWLTHWMPQGVCLFSAVPVYDPSHRPAASRIVQDQN